MTLFTSVTDTSRRHLLKSSLVYLLVAMFCALFGAIYEHFSHEVYSYYMIYAFGFPLALGTGIYMILSVFDKAKLPSRLVENLYNAGVATLTVGSIIKGVLIIYGTANSLSTLYFIVGITLIAVAVLIYAFKLMTDGKANKI